MATEIVNALWEATLAGSLAIVVVLVLRVPLRRMFGARSVRGVWLMALLAPLATLLPASVAVTPVARLTYIAAAAPQGLDAAAQTATQALPWTTWLLAAWLAGVGLGMFATWRRQRAFMRGLGALTPLGAGVWRAASAHGTPALIGVLAPRIVVPDDFETRYNATERALVLAHERNHRAVGDGLVNALAMLSRCVFWFNPLMHVAVATLRLDQELACDAAVLEQHPTARRSYAEALLKTQAGPLLPIGCQWRAGAVLVRRVRMLAVPAPTRARRTAGALVAASLALSSAVVAWAAQPERVTSAASSDAGYVQARIVLRPLTDVGQTSADAFVLPETVVRAGEEFVVRMDEYDNVWGLHAVATPRADGKIGLHATFLRAGEVQMEWNDVQTEGETVFMRSPPRDGINGAVAEITLWRASGAGAATPHDVEARAHGRVVVNYRDTSDTGFFDGAPGHEFSITPAPDSPLRMSYRVDNLTADSATVHASIERTRNDGSIEVLAQPVLVVKRGEDASIQIDLGAAPGEVQGISTTSTAVEAPFGTRAATSQPAASASTDTIEVSINVDPV